MYTCFHQVTAWVHVLCHPHPACSRPRAFHVLYGKEIDWLHGGQPGAPLSRPVQHMVRQQRRVTCPGRPRGGSFAGEPRGRRAGAVPPLTAIRSRRVRAKGGEYGTSLLRDSARAPVQHMAACHGQRGTRRMLWARPCAGATTNGRARHRCWASSLAESAQSKRLDAYKLKRVFRRDSHQNATLLPVLCANKCAIPMRSHPQMRSQMRSHPQRASSSSPCLHRRLTAQPCRCRALLAERQEAAGRSLPE